MIYPLWAEWHPTDAFWMALFGFLATALNILVSSKGANLSQENKDVLHDVQGKVNGQMVEAVNKAKDEARRISAPRVLIVEDDEHDMELARRELEKFNAIVFEAHNSVEAERLLMANIGPGRGYPFDFVLLDLKIPGDDTSDVFRTFTLKAPKVPIVVLTGHPADTSTIDFSGIPRVSIVKPLLAHHVKSLLEQFGVPYTPRIGTPDREPPQI